MRKFIFLFFILIFSFLSRFAFISNTPPLLDKSILNYRFIEAFLSILTVYITYLFAAKTGLKSKTALLSAFFMIQSWNIFTGGLTRIQFTLLILKGQVKYS